MRKREAIPDDPVYQGARAVLKSLARWVEDKDFTDELTEQQSAAEQRDDTAGASQPLRPEDRVECWPKNTWRDLVEALPDAVVVISSHGTIVLVNTQTEKIFGYKREELLGWKIEKLIPNRYAKGHVAKRDEYFKAPETKVMGARQQQLVGRRKDGTEFPVDINLSPLKTDQGMFATSVIRDITQRKREEAKFKTLVENIPAVTFFAPLDESAPELYVSPQIQQLLGFSAKEWLEDPVLWHRQLHPEDRETWNKEFAPTCAEWDKPFVKTYRFIAKDGRVVWVRGSASVVRDADGTPSFLQGVAFDITEIKESEERLRAAEETLRQSNAELGRRVEKRTEELAQAMAESQIRAKELEIFAYQASHDLGKPLRSLKMYPIDLKRTFGGKIDPTAEEWLDKTIGGVERFERLFKSLEQYAKVVEHRPYEAMDASASARHALANLQPDIDESKAQVLLDELPGVIGDRDQLVFLFQNLIGNAIKFRAPDRPLRVEVGARRDQDCWLFWVRDNGIGIEEEYYTTRPKLFMPKFGDEARVAANWQEIPGNGYGLHICKTIVTRHGGKIWVESEFGAGSAFYFTLPAAPA